MSSFSINTTHFHGTLHYSPPEMNLRAMHKWELAVFRKPTGLLKSRKRSTRVGDILIWGSVNSQTLGDAVDALVVNRYVGLTDREADEIALAIARVTNNLAELAPAFIEAIDLTMRGALLRRIRPATQERRAS